MSAVSDAGAQVGAELVGNDCRVDGHADTTAKSTRC